MNGITLHAGELFLGGMVVFAVLTMVVKARTGAQRARAAAEVARVGTSVVSLAGRVLVTAAAIVGVQWLMITYAAANVTLLLVVLTLPALFAAYTLTKALTVTEVRSTKGRGRR